MTCNGGGVPAKGRGGWVGARQKNNPREMSYTTSLIRTGLDDRPWAAGEEGEVGLKVRQPLPAPATLPLRVNPRGPFLSIPPPNIVVS